MPSKELKENKLLRLPIRMTPEDAYRFQKAWAECGEFKTRSQFIKAAVNAYVGEEVFGPMRAGHPRKEPKEDC